MPKIPAPFQASIEILERNTDLLRHGWTSAESKCYYFAIYRDRQTKQLTFCKMTPPNKIGTDDKSTKEGLQRVVWFRNLLTGISRKHGKILPFQAPTIVDQNVTRGLVSNLSFVIMRYLEEGQSCSRLPGHGEDTAEFKKLCETMADCHYAFQQITPVTVSHCDSFQIFPATLSHQALGWRNKVLVEMLRLTPPPLRFIWTKSFACLQKQARLRIENHPNDFVLNPGAFERRNFFQPQRDAYSAEIINTEFAGWSRRENTLANAFIDLWVNEQRPELAQTLLRTYVGRYDIARDSEFYVNFFREILGLLCWQNFRDTFRHGHVRRSSPCHASRRQLKQVVKKRDYGNLLH